MVSKTQHGNGLINHLHQHNTIITIITTQRILATKELMKKYGALPQPTKVCYQNHGEDKRKPILRMDLKILPGNGQTNQHLQLSTTIIINTIINHVILVTRELMKKYGVLLQQIKVFYQNHGEEQKNHILKMDSKIQNGNGWIHQHKKVQLLNKVQERWTSGIPNTSDQTSSNSSMRTLAKPQLGE